MTHDACTVVDTYFSARNKNASRNVAGPRREPYMPREAARIVQGWLLPGLLSATVQISQTLRW
jgi:hypothetical protein